MIGKVKMNKKYFNWDTITSMTMKIASQIRKSNWRPDYIVGLTRGGLVPAVLLSHELDVPCETLKVSLRDSKLNEKYNDTYAKGIAELESNYWMAEDAYEGKKILIVDDINDTGETLLWIQEDWRDGAFPGNKRWEDIWGNNVRVAVLHDNMPSKFQNVTYVASEINKNKDPQWIVYPWEKDDNV